MRGGGRCRDDGGGGGGRDEDDDEEDDEVLGGRMGLLGRFCLTGGVLEKMDEGCWDMRGVGRGLSLGRGVFEAG